MRESLPSLGLGSHTDGPRDGRAADQLTNGLAKGWRYMSVTEGQNRSAPGVRLGRRPVRRAALAAAAVVAVAGGVPAATAAEVSAAPSWHIVKRVAGGSNGVFTAVTAVGRNGGWAFDGFSQGDRLGAGRIDLDAGPLPQPELRDGRRERPRARPPASGRSPKSSAHPGRCAGTASTGRRRDPSPARSAVPSCSAPLTSGCSARRTCPASTWGPGITTATPGPRWRPATAWKAAPAGRPATSGPSTGPTWPTGTGRPGPAPRWPPCCPPSRR